MTSINLLAQHMRSLRLNSMAIELETLITQAEDNELSYLQFTDSLLEHEVGARNQKRIAINRRKGDFQ